MTRDETIELCGLIATYWPHWNPPGDDDEFDVMVDAWLRLLGEVPQRAAVAAVEACAVNHDEYRFPPGPGAIRSHALALSAPVSMPDVDEAWAEIRDQISHTGRYGLPTFTHPAIDAAVHSIGWLTLCDTTDEMATRAHFIRFYGRSLRRATADRDMPASVRELLASIPRHEIDPAEPAAPSALPSTVGGSSTDEERDA